MSNDAICHHCNGPIAVRNPSGTCDHLYWPDNLTAEARLKNGLLDESAKRFAELVIAYKRGAEWMRENNDPDYLFKAAYDYADKITSPETLT